MKPSSAAVLVTKPWSWEEMFIGRYVICGGLINSTLINFDSSRICIIPSPSAPDLYDVFEKCGPVPRVCFHLVGDEREMLAYNRQLQSAPMESGPIPQLMENRWFSDAFSQISSVLLMIPDGSRLPLLIPISRHTIRIVASRITTTLILEIYKFLDLEPYTKRWAGDFFQTVVLQHIMEETISYNCILPYIVGRNSTTPLQRSHVVTLESIPAVLLNVDHCYLFEKSGGIRSYDALIRTRTGSSSQKVYIHLLKVVAESDSPIYPQELDELADKFPNQWSGKPGYNGSYSCYWQLIFIVPSSMRDTFGKQRFEGAGKYDWEKSSYFTQVVASV